MNSIVFEKTRIFSFEFVKLYISIVLCCFIIIQKNTEKTTTQYNTITQYNLVKFKGFFAEIVFCYCIVLCSRYCIVFKKTINGTMNSITALCCFQNNQKKKPTTQYNTITQYNFVKFKVFCRNCTLLLYCVVFGTI